MTHQVGIAQERLYREHKDTIIKTFKNVGLSLNPDRSEDHKLKIKDLPDLIVGDYNLLPAVGLADNPIIIPDNGPLVAPQIILGDEEVDEPDTFITAREAIKGVIIKEEDLDVVTTDSEDDTDKAFDYDSDKDFDNDIDSDELDNDENIEQSRDIVVCRIDLLFFALISICIVNAVQSNAGLIKEEHRYIRLSYKPIGL